MTGYQHTTYTRSLREFGWPHDLPECGGTILVRQIPQFPHSDGIGCYPLFSCRDWSKLHVDLKNLEEELVSLSLVLDPFGNYDTCYLQKTFDKVVLFKDHYIVDLRYPLSQIVSNHHRYYARRALRDLCVEKHPNPVGFLNQWLALYACLTERHKLRGIKAFSRQAFVEQLRVPGLVMFTAASHGDAVAAHLWYVQDGVAYSHLAASNQQGYEQRASYALYWSAIEYFRDQKHLRWLDLGAGAGLSPKSQGGLSEFKRGWATGTQPAYFCARVFNRTTYVNIVQAKGIGETSYFPAYRHGEFA